MASNDLEGRKTTLEDGIDSLSAWMIGFTWPVAIGLVMEFYAVFNLEWTKDWNTLIDRIGLLFVTAGVAGELAVEQLTRTREQKLRGVNAEMEREAEVKLKAADERISEAQERAALAAAHAARANLELFKLKTPRTLSPEQQARINASISRFAGTDFDIYVSHDAESVALMNVIDDVLVRSGWHRIAPKSDIVIDGKAGVRAVSGVQIIRFAGAREALETPLVALATALLNEGIATLGGNWIDEVQNKTSLHVVVGSKPLQ